MAISYKIDKHHVCFPSKVLSGQVGHVLNMVIDEDVDNGSIFGIGDYVSFDQYKTGAVPSALGLKILEQAADGNWYVQVTAVDVNKPAVLIYEVPIIAETYNSEFTNIDNFYNKKGKTVRGYVLSVMDVFEISADAFTGTPADGKSVTVAGQKLVVGAGA